MNILITSAGKRVSLVRAFQRELKSFYPHAKVFTTDLHPRMSAACMIADGYFEVCNTHDDHYIDQLLELCVSHQIGMIIPTIDTDLLTLSLNKLLFSKYGVNIIVSSPEFIRICRDKRRTAEFFQRRGIDVPRMMDKHNPEYPLFIKPYDGSLSADTHVIHSSQEMKQEFIENDRLIFTEYFAKELYDEFTVDMYYDAGHISRCIVPRQRLLVRAGEVAKGKTCKNIILHHLRDKLHFMEGAVGCITAQFFLHKNRPEVAGIEINARFGGGYPLSYHAGANFPQWLIREYYHNEPISYFEGWEDQMLMLRYDEEVIIHANQHQPEQLLHI